MAFSKVIIVFNSVPVEGGYIYIKETTKNIFLYEGFYNNRYGSGSVKVPDYLAADAINPPRYDGYISYNYKLALDYDFNNSNLFNISISNGEVYSGLGTVEITANFANAIFEVVEVNVGSCDTFVINETHEDNISIDEFIFSAFSPSPGTKVNVNVSTSRLATGYFFNNDYSSIVENFTNPLVYSMVRGTQHYLTVFEDYNGFRDSVNIYAPAVLSVDNTNIESLDTPSGSNIKVNLLSTQGFVPEFSLDGITWKFSNTFEGLSKGNYTVYIKDNLGYSISIPFVITDFEPSVTLKKAFSYVSKAMSIRFKKNEDFYSDDIYKNDENTLSCEESVVNSYKYVQKFKPINLIKTQLLSNYNNISVNLIKADNSKTSVPLINKISFIDLKDTRDARIYSIESGKTGVYYMSGNIYDYLDVNVVKNTYSLNGSLPDYAAIGNYVKLGGIGWFKIIDIIYSNEKNADVLVFDYNYTTQDSSLVVSCNYNKKNFNVYEFAIDFALYNNQEVQVEILQTSDDFPPANYLSEIIEVKDYFENCVEIIWYNKTDSLVFYSTGIKNLGNFEYTTFESDNDSNLEVHKTTSTSIVIEASNYELKTLLIEDLSTCIMQQLSQAALHKQIFVNKVKFVSSDKPNIENIKFTNIYSIEMNLLKTGDVYNSDLAGAYNG